MTTHVPTVLPSVTPSGAANYTTSHNQVELVLQPQVVKTGEVRVSGCGLVHEASDCVGISFSLLCLQNVTVEIKAN